MERPSYKLDYQMVYLYKILEKVGNSYKVDLLEIVKVHLVFSLDKLQKALDDPLPRQKNELLLLVQVDSDNKWEVEKILASKLIQRSLYYQVNQKGYDPNLTWYPTQNFIECPNKLKEFHDQYPNQLGPLKYLDEWITSQYNENDRQPIEYKDKNALAALAKRL